LFETGALFETDALFETGAEVAGAAGFKRLERSSAPLNAADVGSAIRVP
jgi:hypothetical protein